jgi:hypothetical protein
MAVRTWQEELGVDPDLVLAELERINPTAARAARRTIEDTSLVKDRRFNIRLSQAQYDALHNDARTAGYRDTAEYVRVKLGLPER